MKINKISGNDIHAFMDRFAKQYRQKHRDVGGHDNKALIKMVIGNYLSQSNTNVQTKSLLSNILGVPLFNKPYTTNDVIKTFVLHKALDGAFSGFADAVKARNKGYGKKEQTKEAITRLKKELFRI